MEPLSTVQNAATSAVEFVASCESAEIYRQIVTKTSTSIRARVRFVCASSARVQIEGASLFFPFFPCPPKVSCEVVKTFTHHSICRNHTRVGEFEFQWIRQTS